MVPIMTFAATTEVNHVRQNWKNGAAVRYCGCYLSSAHLKIDPVGQGTSGQKVVCYIGSISRYEDPFTKRRLPFCDRHGKDFGRRFWKSAEKNLTKAGIVGAELERIVSTLELTVPRPVGPTRRAPRHRGREMRNADGVVFAFKRGGRWYETSGLHDPAPTR